MKRFVPCAVILALAGAAPLQAQFFVGAGPTIPTSDFGNYAKTGWMAIGGMQFSLTGMPIKIRVEGMYGSNTHDGTASEKTNLYGGMANAVFGLGGGPVGFYLVGGVGYLDHHYDPGSSGNPSADEWKAVFGGGAGLNFGLGPLHAFAEARYLNRDNTAFFPVTVGLRFGM